MEQYNVKREKNDTERKLNVEGQRVIHIKTLGKQMICKKCYHVLSLQNIVNEVRFGLSSVYYKVRCKYCQNIT